MMQDALKVRSTRDLDSKFILLAAVSLDPLTSNATHKNYVAQGRQLSIDDYENNTKVETCLKRTCEYVYNLWLRISPKERKLEIDITLTNSNLSDIITITELRLYSIHETISQKLAQPIEVKGAQKVTIPLDEAKKEHTGVRT